MTELVLILTIGRGEGMRELVLRDEGGRGGGGGPLTYP